MTNFHSIWNFFICIFLSSHNMWYEMWLKVHFCTLWHFVCMFAWSLDVLNIPMYIYLLSTYFHLVICCWSQFFIPLANDLNTNTRQFNIFSMSSISWCHKEQNKQSFYHCSILDVSTSQTLISHTLDAGELFYVFSQFSFIFYSFKSNILSFLCSWDISCNQLVAQIFENLFMAVTLYMSFNVHTKSERKDGSNESTFWNSLSVSCDGKVVELTCKQF